MKWIEFVFAFLLMGIATTRIGTSQAATVVAPESEIWIEGKSNVSKFSCRARSMSGYGRVAAEGATERVSADAEALLAVSVLSFDCGNARMNSDLFEALKADTHPTIHFKMERANVVGYQPSGSVELDVTGIIMVAGVARSVQTRVVGDRLANGQLRAAGAILVSMRDFKINPPTALLGLVRTRNDITVRFDLVAAPSTGVSMVGRAHAN